MWSLIASVVCFLGAAFLQKCVRTPTSEFWTEKEKTKLKRLADGDKKTVRMVYNSDDASDYLIVCIACYGLLRACYGRGHLFERIGGPLCLYFFLAFCLRHGATFRRPPLLVSEPLAPVHAFVYKLGNLKPVVAVSMGLTFLDHFCVGAVQQVTHWEEELRTGYLWMFYICYAIVAFLRVVSLVAHLASLGYVHDFLIETGWKKLMTSKPRTCHDLFHACANGLLTHALLLAPLHVMITHLDTSAFLLPFRVPLGVWLVQKFDDQDLNEWYYRDHWLGHNTLFEFLYMHGPHHDALPVGMMSAAETGFLEAPARHSCGHPDSWQSPPYAIFRHTLEIIKVFVGHQYVPGVFPYSRPVVENEIHHIEHHFLSMFPLANGGGEARYSKARSNVKFDAFMDGYNAENKTWAWFCAEQVAREKGTFSELLWGTAAAADEKAKAKAKEGAKKDE